MPADYLMMLFAAITEAFHIFHFSSSYESLNKQFFHRLKL